MVLTNIGFKVAAMLFLIFIIIFYSKGQKLPKSSTRCFSLMLGITVLNISFDIITVYTVWNLDSVPEWLNRLSHQILIASLDTIIFLYYWYINLLGVEQGPLIKKKLIRSSYLYIISLLFVVFSPLYYYNNGKIAYSYGPMIKMLYASIAIYLLMIASSGFYYRKTIRKEVLNSVVMGISLWVALAITQYHYPGVLLSGMGTVLMIFLLYLSFENPREKEEEDTGLMNDFAFKVILNEWCRKKEVFCVANIVLMNYPLIYAGMKKNEVSEELRQIFEKPNLKKRGLYYHTEERIVSFFIEGAKEEASLEAERFYNLLLNSSIDLKSNLQFKIEIFECPGQAKTIDEASQILSFINTETFSFEKGVNIRIMDEEYLKRIRRRFKVELLLKEAVASQGVDIFYQPIYDTNAKKFLSAEALVRLKDSTTIGFVSPEEFIPVAEQNGLIIELGDIIFEKLCRFVKQVDLKSYGIDYVKVNLSGIQCIDKELPKRLKSIMNKYGLSPGYFNLEITETVSVNGLSVIEENMNILRNMGCSFSMDDFGTGYSNLSQVAEMLFEMIKLDKSLVWGYFAGKDEKVKVLFKHIISMLQELKLKIVAEGVETEEQAQRLSHMGVDYLQGYYYSKPVNELDFINLLK